MARRKPKQYRRVRVDAIEPASGGNVLGFLAVLIIVPVFVLGLIYVKLNSDEVKLKRELSHMRRVFGLRSKELANLRVEAEMYRDGNHIGNHMKTMGLELGEPDHGQVIRMPAGTPLHRGVLRSDAVVAER